MSYDFTIFRAPQELTSLQDIVAADVLLPGDWRAEAQHLLVDAVPNLVWSTADGKYEATCCGPHVGRFELSINYIDGIAMVSIRGSNHANQLELTKSCARAIGGYAFDMQSCERIWPEVV